jgi:hypothetical protein
MVVFEVKSGSLKEAEIVKAANIDLPLKKDGWSFNWRVAFKKANSEIYVLRLKQDKDKIVQGIVQLVFLNGMISMELIEIHPNNRGKNKKFDFVAGCLIAFGCRESFKLDNDYEGYLTFESKTVLIDVYREKYGATQTFKNKMYISPQQGMKLISKYLDHKK